MKQIQQAAFGLLTLSILALLIVTGSYAIHVATDQPSLYTPPPEMRSHSNVRMVREATNIEGLRKVCEHWAEWEDRSRAMINMQSRTFEQMMRSVAIGLTVFGGVFVVGLGYIYMGLQRLQRSRANAL